MKISDEYINNFSKERLFLTPLEDALKELRRRGKDPSLRYQIERYLDDDIPHYFKNESIGYLARHVATPNFETIHFLNVCNQNNLPAFIGQDSGDIFVSSNPLKKALGKLAIHSSERQDDPLFIYNTVVDFNTTQGKHFRDIETIWGESLIQFHNNLFSHFYKNTINIFDDSSWIDRHDRNDIREHYKKFLSLLVVHGVMFEYYLKDDPHELMFVKEVLIPAFIFVEKKFGHRPLIVSLVRDGDENKDWYGYPSLKKVLLPQVTPFTHDAKKESAKSNY